VILAANGAQAATLDVIGGQLYGASDVDVGGTLYDVEFVDGTCIVLFNGCDDATDFTFTDQASADLASQALLDQVFLDVSAGSFDSSPALAVGCDDLEVCGVLIPFDGNSSNAFSASISVNKAPVPSMVNFLGIPYAIDSVGEILGGQAHIDTGEAITSGRPNDALVWARWQSAPIPEPNTAILLGLGMAGLARFRRH